MIKFSGVELEDKEDKEPMFVRQKTPHPKELKAKAHKLFGSPQKNNSEVSNYMLCLFAGESQRLNKIYKE